MIKKLFLAVAILMFLENSLFALEPIRAQTEKKAIDFRLLDLKGNQVREPFKGDAASFSTASFSPDGQFIVIAGKDGAVQLWDFKNNKSRTLGTHKGAATSAVFSPDGRYILTGSEDRTVRLLTGNNFLVFEFKDFMEIIHTATFSPDVNIY